MSRTPNDENENEHETPEAERVGETDAAGVPDELAEVDADEPGATDQWVQVHQAHYDHESEEELVTAIVFAVAEAKDVDLLDYAELPPLYEIIDAESLEETFFGSGRAGTQREDGGVVTFTYNEYKIAVQADGWIFVYESA